MGPASFCVAGAGLGALELLLHGRSVRGVLGAAFAWQVRRFDCFGTAAGLMIAVGPGEAFAWQVQYLGALRAASEWQVR